MGVFYVQTWMVSKGKIEEHEKLMVKRLRYVIPKYLKGRERPVAMYFAQRHGPIGGRILILNFDTVADHQKFVDTMSNDGEFNKLVDEWLAYVDPDTWRGTYWDELMREEIQETLKKCSAIGMRENLV